MGQALYYELVKLRVGQVVPGKLESRSTALNVKILILTRSGIVINLQAYQVSTYLKSPISSQGRCIASFTCF